MKYALHAILIVLEKIVLGSLNGFGVERPTWQREGLISVPIICSELKETAMSIFLMNLVVLY